MRKHGKKFTAARAQVAADRNYTIEDAIPLVQKVKFAKFDETVELTLRLGVDPEARRPDGPRHGRAAARPRARPSACWRSPAARSRRKPRKPAPTSSAARRWSRRSRAASWTSTPSSPRPT